eukprot:6250727-Pyramimonas_sp.AAC.1
MSVTRWGCLRRPSTAQILTRGRSRRLWRGWTSPRRRRKTRIGRAGHPAPLHACDGGGRHQA